jgi:hypothetical protein
VEGSPLCGAAVGQDNAALHRRGAEIQGKLSQVTVVQKPPSEPGGSDCEGRCELFPDCFERVGPPDPPAAKGTTDAMRPIYQ